MNNKEWKIGTLASHSALTILSGAKKEGFGTVLFSDKRRKQFYESFDIADEIIVIDDFVDVFQKCDTSTILIPHGSFVAYLPLEEILASSLNIFGTKELLKWESNRILKDKLLEDANLRVPKSYDSIDKAEFPIIVKYDGADGGKGYFIANSKEEYLERNNIAKNAFLQQ
ncbi:MAG: DUF1246 domain-containing protein, partial [Candidatus Kariarchaeaceae archaeon]